jgi:hypothetical protein
MLRVDSDVQMITLIGKEGGDTSCSGGNIIVGKLSQRKEGGPIVLLVIAINPKILFKGLIGPFGLTITFGVVS